MTDTYTALIHSDRVSAKTREALLERAEPDAADYAPKSIDPAAYATLRAVLARVLPQDRVDIAQRIDKALTTGESDGWRFAVLPADAQGYAESLAALAGFGEQPVAAQDGLLDAIAAGDRGEPLQRWFEDMRGQATMIYASHPSTFARMGYSGIGYGGDGEPKIGFHLFGIGKREAWEPLAEQGALS